MKKLSDKSDLRDLRVAIRELQEAVSKKSTEQRQKEVFYHTGDDGVTIALEVDPETVVYHADFDGAVVTVGDLAEIWTRIGEMFPDELTNNTVRGANLEAVLSEIERLQGVEESYNRIKQEVANS